MNLTTFVCFCVLYHAASAQPSDEEALQRARTVLQRYPLVDGHNDLPIQMRLRVQNRIDEVDLRTDITSQWGPSHTDIPRLRQGQVGAQFWAAYVSCTKMNKDAVRANLEQIDVILRMIEDYDDVFELVTTAQGIEDAFVRGKIGSLIAMEGAHVIDSSIANLRITYDLGARLMTLTHSCDLPWAYSSNIDSNDEPPAHTGLSDWGKLVVGEMNRLGMIIDVSHVSRQTMIDAIETSDAPVVFSHSNAWSLCQATRNVQDDVLHQMAAKGGVIMITFVGSYVACPPIARLPTAADVSLVADHIDYVKNLIGADYVGIGSDYDGTFGLPTGLENVSSYPNLFAELVKRGWSDLDLEKLAGRNLVRAFKEIERVRDDMAAAGVIPLEEWIPSGDLDPNNLCRTPW